MIDNSNIFDFDNCAQSPIIFDVSLLEAMTQLTELHIAVPFVDKQQDLKKLTQLKRLTLDYVTRRQEHPGTAKLSFVCPRIASITKLAFRIADKVRNYGCKLTAWHL